MANRYNLQRVKRWVSVLSMVAGVMLSADHATAQPVADRIRTDMQALYQGLSGAANQVASNTMINAPGAFHGQTYNTYTGGSLMLRTPSKNIQLATIDMPRFAAGCGGIDMHLGAMSHLSGDQLVQFIQTAAAQTPGVLAQVAISAITPLLAGRLEWAKGIIDRINGFNLNSCQVAKSTVDGLAGAMTMANNSSCIDTAMYVRNMSAAEAQAECQNSNQQNAMLQQGKAHNPNMVPFTGNFVWEALKKSGAGLSREERELIMSVVGTVNFYGTNPPRDGVVLPTGDGAVPTSGDGMRSANVPPKTFVATVTDLHTLLWGHEDGANPDTVQLDVYRCPASLPPQAPSTEPNDPCWIPSVARISMPSFAAQVEADLNQIIDRVEDGDQPLTASQVSLLNRTTLPVWRMINIGTQTPGSSIARSLVAQYKEIIAADYVYVLMSSYVKAGLKAMNQQFNLTTAQADHIQRIIGYTAHQTDEIRAQRDAFQAKLTNMNSLSQELETIERNLRANMPTQVAGMLSMPGVLSGN